MTLRIFAEPLRALRIELASERSEPLAVYLDLSAPNLVDLLDEISHGPHGDRVVALAATITSHDLLELPIHRGIGTLIDRGIALVLLPGSLAKSNVQARWPQLRLLEASSIETQLDR